MKISLGEHHQQSATLMPTIVMVKPSDQVKHVPVNAANVEIENDTCVFMPTAGALINKRLSDDR